MADVTIKHRMPPRLTDGRRVPPGRDAARPATEADRTAAGRKRPGADGEPASPAQLVEDLRRARDAYLDALQRAYRAGISARDLRAEGAVGRELE